MFLSLSRVDTVACFTVHSPVEIARFLVSVLPTFVISSSTFFLFPAGWFGRQRNRMQRDTRRHRVYNHSRVAVTPLTSTMTVFFLLRCRILFYRADSTSRLLSVSFLDELDVTRRSSFAVPLFSQRGTTSSGARVHSSSRDLPIPFEFFLPFFLCQCRRITVSAYRIVRPRMPQRRIPRTRLMYAWNGQRVTFVLQHAVFERCVRRMHLTISCLGNIHLLLVLIRV